MKNTIIILAVFALFGSCASLPVFEPIPEQNFTDETTFSGYDADSKVAWIVTTDSSNLYIRVETSYRMSKVKILRGGFHVYFSSTGKKDKEQYVNFPVKKTQDKKTSEEDTENSARAQGRNRRRQSTEEVIAKINPLAEYRYGEKTSQFHYKVDTNEFKIDLAEDSNSTFRYTIRIPFDKMVDDINDINGLSVGLVSGAFDIPINSRPMPSNRPTNMPASNRVPNANNPMAQRSTWQGGAYSEMAEPIKIWFKIDKVL